MDDTVLQLLRAEIAGLRSYVEARLDSMERATTLARVTHEKRLDGMNEIRAAMKDQSLEFARRNEVEQRLSSIEEDIRGLRESRAEIIGKASASSVYAAYALAVAGLVISFVSLMTR